MRPRGLVIAIDGTSGAGKSTAGRALAARLGYTYVDTGAMYRALALKALRLGTPLENGLALSRLLAETEIELTDGGKGIRLDGEDVTSAIRTREVSTAASQVSTNGGVRRDLVARQQRMGHDGGIVMDGRDIGTAVFPDADLKVYIDADPLQRARRRHAELVAAGARVDLASVERDVLERDRLDQERAESPLVRAEDAVYVDTTHLTAGEVVDRLLRLAEELRRSPA